MYTAVVTRPFGASLRLFKIGPDDFVASVRLALSALAPFLEQLLRGQFSFRTVGDWPLGSCAVVFKTASKPDGPLRQIVQARDFNEGEQDGVAVS